jgi:RsiW-degrading membrane proteinase PrsW (M82 family)
MGDHPRDALTGRAKATRSREDLTGMVGTAAIADRRVLRGRAAKVLGLVLVLLVLGLCGILLLGAISSQTGVPGLLVGCGLALVPVPFVVGAFMWLDRFEPEPAGVLWFCFIWGAVVAALTSALINTAAAVAAVNAGASETSATATSAVFVAPFVEELTKGLGVLAILLFKRREFDGVVDGIVLAGVTAVGFAFSENILYFGRAFLEGTMQAGGTTGGIFVAGVVFIMRGIVSPFAHPLFTVMIGIGVGLAARTAQAWVRVLAPLVGYVAAVALHATWNYSSLGGVGNFGLAYLLIMVPVFGTAVALALWQRRREGRVVARQLPPYVEAGWIGPADVPMLADLRARRRALAWAGSRHGPYGRAAMKAFQRHATELAFLRERAEHGTVHGDFASREQALLGQVHRERMAFAPPLR